MDGVHFAAVPAPSLVRALPAGWGTEASASQCRARLRGCVHRPLRHPPDPLGGGSRGHPHSLRHFHRRTSSAGALPRDADERVPLLPAGADALERAAAAMELPAADRRHSTCRLPAQRGDRIRAVSLRAGTCGDGRRDLQHAWRAARRGVAVCRARHRKTQRKGSAHEHDPDRYGNTISAYRQSGRFRRGDTR